MIKLYKAIALSLLMTCGAANAETLTNDSVIMLGKAGLGTDAIIAKIKSSASSFDLTTNGLIALKSANVSDAVIAAMLSVAQNNISEKSNLDFKYAANPAEIHPSGIYLLENWNVNPVMQQLQPDRITESVLTKAELVKSAATWGLIKAKAFGRLEGLESSVRSPNQQPKFFFYFDKSTVGIEAATSVATSPSDFFLLKFKQKNGLREMFLGKGNQFGSRGLISRDSIKFTSKRLSSTSYEVSFAEPLEKGEYAFTLLSSQGVRGSGTAVAYTFSVQ